jgi:hypothetical protein
VSRLVWNPYFNLGESLIGGLDPLLIPKDIGLRFGKFTSL